MSLDEDLDVLVIGFGAAGANAAIAAYDAGAKVAILEKMATGGGNSALCAGGMLVPATLDEAISYYRGLSCGTADEETIRGFAEAMVEVPELLSDLGIEFAAQPDARASYPSLAKSRLRQIHVSPTGQNGFKLLRQRVEERGIEVMYNTQVKKLLQRPGSREVIGITASKGGSEITLFARRGVILCSGGYASDPAMLADFNVPGISNFVFSWGAPGNTGDGIRMAQEAGAALWHMASIEWGKICALEPSKYFGVAIGYGLGRTNSAGSYLFVNQHGCRFMAEDRNKSHVKELLPILSFDGSGAEYANLPAYMIFDEAMMRRRALAYTAASMNRVKGGLIGHPLVNGVYDWSRDNRAELDLGWIVQADSVEALAQEIDCDPEGLMSSVARFNEACDGSEDREFGRDSGTLLPLREPPFYAIELGLAVLNTQGGPKRNRHCQVVDVNDVEIPRLYSAGELGSFFGFLYQPGSNYPEAWIMGNKAGKLAAREVPWRD